MLRYKKFTQNPNLKSLIPQFFKSNSAIDYSLYVGAPIWLVVNELLRAESNVGVPTLLVDPSNSFALCAWDSSCWGEKRGITFDYSTLHPLTENLENLQFSLNLHAQELCPIIEVPRKFAGTYDWIQFGLEFYTATSGLIDLDSPSALLSKPMKKRRTACVKISKSSDYSLLDLDDTEVSDDGLLDLLNSWRSFKEGRSEEVQVSDEYSILLRKKTRSIIRDQYGVPCKGLVLKHKPSKTYVGAVVSSPISSSTWTTCVRITRRIGSGVVPYISEYLWRKSALQWPSVMYESDGNVIDSYDEDCEEVGPGLSFQKALYANATGGKVTPIGVLVNPSSVAQHKRYEDCAERLINRHKLLNEANCSVTNLLVG